MLVIISTRNGYIYMVHLN